MTSATAGSIDSLEMRLVLSVTDAATSTASNYTDKNRFDYDNHDGKKKHENY